MAPSSSKHKRQRIIQYQWTRKDNGEWLPSPGPSGKRPPNGTTWASTYDRFYYIKRKPGIPAVTIWSFSMIEEFNENFDEVARANAFAPERDPKMYLPFPWLRIPSQFGTLDGNKLLFRDCWTSIQGIQREGGTLPVLDGFDPSKPIKFGNVYKSQCKLEEFIPAIFFPDILVVNDPKGITEGKRVEGTRVSDGCDEVEDTPRKYKRVWPLMDTAALSQFPKFGCWASEDERHNVAYLNLAGAPLLGRGHHSAAHRGALKLPLDVEAYTGDGSIGVAAKVAFGSRGARQFLEHEGGMYNQIYGRATNSGMDFIDEEGDQTTPSYDEEDGKKNKRHLMEHWGGYCIVNDKMRYPVPVRAVVPKFFGYYVPTDESEAAVKERHGEEKDEEFWRCQEYDDDELNELAETRLSPILLIEDCGTPINPKKMSIDDRTECLSFLFRLANESISHSSFYARNILVQPGPLDVGPPRRSMKTPSYRLIDLGRANTFAMRIERDKERYKERTGEDLKDATLPVGPDGYVRDDIVYEGAQAELKKTNWDWAMYLQAEATSAKQELLLDPFE